MQGLTCSILLIGFIAIKNSAASKKVMFFDTFTLRHYDTFGENYIGIKCAQLLFLTMTETEQRTFNF